MREAILVLPRVLVDGTYGSSNNQLLGADEQSFKDMVAENLTYAWRDEAETNETLKQVIAYCVITSGDRVFVTKRTKKQTEARLHDRRSIGVGGHINHQDGLADPVGEGLLRELYEEVYIGPILSMRYRGLINDNSTAVNTVHVGLCYTIEVANQDCAVRETDKMSADWMTVEELRSVYDSLEGWSQIAMNSLFGRE